MEILRRCLSLDLSRDGCPKETPTFILSRELLTFRLTITFSNEHGDHSRDGAALLAAFGEHDFTVMWRKLFHTLSIAPVILSSNRNDPTTTTMTTTGTSFSFGAPPFWGGRPVSDSAAECSPAGKVFSVPVAIVDVTPMVRSGDGQVNPHASGTAPKTIVPARLQSTYYFSYTLPDFDAHEGPITMGYVLLLPFPSSATNDKDCADDVMLCAVAPPAERGLLSWQRPLSVVLGTFQHHTCVAQAIKCTSVARPSSNFRSVVNINVINVSKQPVCVRRVSFDIFSTWVGDSLGSLSSVPLWAEQRAGPQSVDLRTVEIMRDAVTITPIVVHGARAPLTLQPEESVGFLFAIQVQPHLHYLFQTHSLRDVYGPYMKNSSSLDLVTKPGPHSSSGATMPKTTTTTTTAAIKTADVTTLIGRPTAVAATVPREELIQVLSSGFTSHVYVHYEVLPHGTTNHNVSCKEGEQQSALQHRQAVHWSLVL